jgi:hypothetical protein
MARLMPGDLPLIDLTILMERFGGLHFETRGQSWNVTTAKALRGNPEPHFIAGQFALSSPQ